MVSQLGLDKSTLSEVWRLSDGERRGYLTKEEFFLALRLVALARLSRPLSLQDAAPATAPQFNVQQQQQPPPGPTSMLPTPPLSQGAPVLATPPLSQGAPALGSLPSGVAADARPPVPQSRSCPPVSLSPSLSPSLPVASLSACGPQEWHITPTERAKFAEIFDKADDDKDGYVTGPQARQLFSRSGLDMEDLSRIWSLSDVDQDHKLSMDEFIIAMYFINARLKGRMLPPTLPPSLLSHGPSSSGSGSGHVQLQPASPAPTYGSQGPSSSGSGSGHTHLQPSSPAPAQSAALPHAAPSVPDEEHWVMTPEERSKYEGVFIKADDDKDGFVSGEQARTMFSRSQLPLPDLAKIWSLADYGKDHRLDKDEFIIAMYFINARLKGRRLPDVLPANLVPAGAALASPQMGVHHQLSSSSSSSSQLTAPLSAGLPSMSPPGSAGSRLSAYGSSGTSAAGAHTPLAQSASLRSLSSLPSSDSFEHDKTAAIRASGSIPVPYGSSGAPPLMASSPALSASYGAGLTLASPPLSGSVPTGAGMGLSASASSLGGFGSADAFDQLAGAAPLSASSPALRPPTSGGARVPASPQLQASLQGATQREGDLRTRIDEVKNLAQQQFKINEEFQKQLDLQLAKNAQLEQDLAREEERADRLAEESLTLSAEWESMKKEGDAVQAKIQATVERALAHATKLQEVQGRMQELLASLAAEKEQLKSAEQDAHNKEQAALREEQELQALQAKLDSLRQKKADALASRQAMDGRVTAAQQATDKLQREVAQLAEEVSGLEAGVVAKQKEVDEKNQQTRALEQQMRQLEQEQEQARASLAALELKSQQQQQQQQHIFQPHFQQQQAPHSWAGGQPIIPDHFGGSPVPQPASANADFFGGATGFFGGGGGDPSTLPQQQQGGGQVNFFDMAVGAGGIDPVETRDFFGGHGTVMPAASPAPPAGGFAFDPFAAFDQLQQQQQHGQQPPAPAGEASFFSTDDAFA